ncbi:type II toxin-antitoxin system RelE/ParE family toxin [bacterium]|nr:type II toxin-antitoxin system RelE/ParE family toxin [bacterium]
MKKVYEIFVLPSAGKDLDKLGKKDFERIIEKINSLSENPYPRGCLKLTTENGYRIRKGRYRILCRVDKRKKAIFVYRIKHRKEAYK